MALNLLPMATTAVIFAAAVTIWTLRRRGAVSFDRTRYPGLVTLRRSALLARYIGLALAVVAFAAVTAWDRLGRGLFLAPAVAGIVLLLALLVGQQSAYKKVRSVGTAALERRRVIDYVPRSLSIAVVVVVAVLLVIGIWTTVVASPDDFGLYRSLAIDTTETGPGGEIHMVSTARGPFPGGYYTLMPAIGIPIVLILGGATLMLTARRPRDGSDPELVKVDDLLRSWMSESVLAAVGLAAGLTLLGISLSAADVLVSLGGVHQRLCLAAGVGAGAVALGALLVSIWCTALILAPSEEGARPS
jgi:hypothetical protein